MKLSCGHHGPLPPQSYNIHDYSDYSQGTAKIIIEPSTRVPVLSTTWGSWQETSAPLQPSGPSALRAGPRILRLHPRAERPCLPFKTLRHPIAAAQGKPEPVSGSKNGTAPSSSEGSDHPSLGSEMATSAAARAYTSLIFFNVLCSLGMGFRRLTRVTLFFR